MKKYLLVMTILLCSAPTLHAATAKEVQSALAGKYEVTKRKLMGGIKKPGTELYVAIPDFSVQAPTASVATVTISDNRITVDEVSQDSERLAVPIGEPMYLLSHRVKNDRIDLHLATVNKYQTRILGVDQERRMQTKVSIPFDNGVGAIDVAEALSLVSVILPSMEEAQSQPAMVAMIENRKKQLKTETVGNMVGSGDESTAEPVSTASSPESPGSDGRSMRGLEAVGAIEKPGCSGMEIVGYAEEKMSTGQRIYYVAIRNNNNAARIVKVHHIGGRNVRNIIRDDRADIQVRAGAIKTYNIDLAMKPPKLFEVLSCL